MRLSVTLLESYRLFRTGPDEYWTFEKFRDDVTRDFVPTPEVLRGRAFDAILERPGRHLKPGAAHYESKGIAFLAPGINEALQALGIWERNDGLCQVKAEAEIAGHTVVGKTDWMLGELIRDYKLTKKEHVERYMESFQWRFYLSMFGCRVFEYWAFTSRPQKNLSKTGLEVLGLNETPKPVRLYAYPAMAAECEQLVRECAEFLERHDLAKHLQPKRRAAA